VCASNSLPLLLSSLPTPASLLFLGGRERPPRHRINNQLKNALNADETLWKTTTVCVSSLVIDEIKRIVKSSEIMKEDDSKWPQKNKDGRQELEIRLGTEHISFEVREKRKPQVQSCINPTPNIYDTTITIITAAAATILTHPPVDG
jgi:hypothetical protein